MSIKVFHVVGARPNFMKLAPLYRDIALKENILQKTIHTGQHYDPLMSDIFFQQLEIPTPEYNLGIGSGTHTQQTAKTMLALEELLLKDKPDWVLVYGDVNSTLAATLVCVKMGIKVAHVEAGLRSYDRQMPEEINRVLTDSVADILLTPSEDANQNLMKEGVSKDKIFLVGNIMIDSLCFALQLIEQESKYIAKAKKILQKNDYQNFILSTVHRPSNVDSPNALKRLIEVFKEIAQEYYFVLPLHPRTHKHLQELNILNEIPEKMLIVEPLSYFDFVYLQKNAFCILTDSGGIQEESTFLQVPCLTLRKNTERPITIEKGSNTLIGDDYDLLFSKIKEIEQGKYKKASQIPLWDGKTAQRISSLILNLPKLGTF